MMNRIQDSQHIRSSIDQLKHHWLHTVLFISTIFYLLPVIAPITMHWGWYGVGNTVYDVYGLFCHQMAHRSYFFFSEQVTYKPEELPIELGGHMPTDTLALRAFRGADSFGWKVAWSDRMISIYGALLMGGYLHWFMS